MAYYTFSISRFFLNCANITHQNDNFCLEGLASIQLIIQLEGGEKENSNTTKAQLNG